MKLTLTSFSFVAENATICKEAVACCFGLGPRRTDAAANRVYRSVKRCECVKSEEDCSDLCNCHSYCGGKVCGGVLKSTKGRQGKKRDPHVP